MHWSKVKELRGCGLLRVVMVPLERPTQSRLKKVKVAIWMGSSGFFGGLSQTGPAVSDFSGNCFAVLWEICYAQSQSRPSCGGAALFAM